MTITKDVQGEEGEVMPLPASGGRSCGSSANPPKLPRPVLFPSNLNRVRELAQLGKASSPGRWG